MTDQRAGLFNGIGQKATATFGVLDEIRAERERQIHLGYDAAHDDAATESELQRAASAYLESAGCFAAGFTSQTADHVGWPWALDRWKPKDQRSDLVRAAALIVAEIERLDREERSEFEHRT